MKIVPIEQSKLLIQCIKQVNHVNGGPYKIKKLVMRKMAEVGVLSYRLDFNRDAVVFNAVLASSIAEEVGTEIEEFIHENGYTSHHLWCWMRNDLYEDGLHIPVGEDNYILNRSPHAYKWKGDDDFLIFLNGCWQEAESADWEFEEIL